MRILHTMIRVTNLEKSIAFYTAVMGMRLLRRVDEEKGAYTLAFLGYGDETADAVLELTYNWDDRTYTKGDGYGHIAIGVPDIHAACALIREKGGNLVKEPGTRVGGKTPIAFVEDPDGYRIELIERNPKEWHL